MSGQILILDTTSLTPSKREKFHWIYINVTESRTWLWLSRLICQDLLLSGGEKNEDGYVVLMTARRVLSHWSQSSLPNFSMLYEWEWKFKFLIIRNCVFGSQGPQDSQIWQSGSSGSSLHCPNRRHNVHAYEVRYLRKLKIKKGKKKKRKEKKRMEWDLAEIYKIINDKEK